MSFVQVHVCTKYPSQINTNLYKLENVRDDMYSEQRCSVCPWLFSVKSKYFSARGRQLNNLLLVLFRDHMSICKKNIYIINI